MRIAILSEVDSRLLLYPLMRVLEPFGSLVVVTSNRQLCRLIDGMFEGEWRNIKIIVDTQGALDETLEIHGVDDSDYDFMILDNVGAISYDKILVPLGEAHSIVFDEDLHAMEEDANVFFVQFGKAQKKLALPKEKLNPKMKLDTKRIMRKEAKADVVVDASSPTEEPETKWEKQQVEQGKPSIRKSIPSVPFPSYQRIEEVEANHVFSMVENNLIKALYDIFKEDLSISQQDFTKRLRDKESSKYVKSTNTMSV